MRDRKTNRPCYQKCIFKKLPLSSNLKAFIISTLRNICYFCKYSFKLYRGKVYDGKVYGLKVE